jgi:protoporphyrinogen oxidase
MKPLTIQVIAKWFWSSKNVAGERIAVVGAGPMGLAVAYQLARDGHQPVVFEADDRVGGMTAAFDFSGLTIERYYHFHCVSDDAFLQILDELGLANEMRWVETKMGYWYQGKLQPWGNPVALLKFQGLGFIAKLRYGLHALWCTKRDDWHPLDKVEATRWIKGWVGAEAYEVLWRRLFDYKFYDYAESLSAAWIWSRVRRIGRSRYNVFREKLGYLEGGSETLLQALKASIETQAGEVRLRTPVSKVIIEDGTVKGVQTPTGIEVFDKVVSTVPLPYVPKLMPDLPSQVLAAFQSVNNIAVVCVIAKLRKAVTENFWLNTNDPEMDIPGLVEYSNLRPLDQHVVYVPFYMPGEHPKFKEPDQAYVEKVKSYLRKINPALRDEDFLDMRASRYRYAQPICEPGYLHKLPPVALPVKGLWIADTSYYYPEDRGISESIGFGRRMAKIAIGETE